MLSVTQVSENRLDIDIEGKVDAEQMTRVLDDYISSIEKHEHMQLLYRIRDLKFPTLGALGVKISHLPSLFKLLRHIDRIAVTSDQDWIQKWVEIEGKLIPGIDMKAFDIDEEDDALEWLTH